MEPHLGLSIARIATQPTRAWARLIIVTHCMTGQFGARAAGQGCRPRLLCIPERKNAPNQRRGDRVTRGVVCNQADTCARWRINFCGKSAANIWMNLFPSKNIFFRNLAGISAVIGQAGRGAVRTTSEWRQLSTRKSAGKCNEINRRGRCRRHLLPKREAHHEAHRHFAFGIIKALRKHICRHQCPTLHGNFV